MQWTLQQQQQQQQQQYCNTSLAAMRAAAAALANMDAALVQRCCVSRRPSHTRQINPFEEGPVAPVAVAAAAASTE